jgi:hypothetical protein
MFSSWADHANPEDAAKAVAAYQEYLRLAPPDDSFHLQCKAIVAGLQKYLAANPVRPK